MVVWWVDEMDRLMDEMMDLSVAEMKACLMEN